jgi:hypothetical protein
MRTELKLGLVGLFAFLSFGMLLEYLLFLDAGFYMGDPFLRRLWNLAHAHGTLAWLLYLVYVPTLERLELAPALRRAGSVCAALGATCLPVGFVLGALAHEAPRPSWPILLVPLGGTLLGTALLLPVLGDRAGPR